jgi:hypothetical protein
MRKYEILILTVFFAAGTAVSLAANHYVREGATGANNGSDWTNAWNELNQINFSAVACGDTIWIAGGTYTTTLSVNKTCTAGRVLNMNRVLSTDSQATAAAGWKSAYDSRVIIRNASINLAAGSYYTINGRQGSVAGDNFGISVQCTTSSGCDGIDGAGSGNLSNVSLSYLELYGPPCVMKGDCGGSGASGLNVAPGSNQVTNLLFDHGWIHQYGEAIRTANWNNCTIQYSSISDTHNDGQQHEDVIFSYPIQNFTFRYNKIWSSPNDGIFFYGNEVNTQIYGNAYYHSGAGLFNFYQGFTHNVYIYNNVFENDGTFGDYRPAWLAFTGTMTGEIANNVWENVNKSGACPICDHNAYSISGNSVGETGSFTYTAGNQFVNESPGNPPLADFHLTTTGATTFVNGETLPAPYSTDSDGNTRGAGGIWYMGDYQYQSSQASREPAAPTVRRGVVN